MKFPLQYNFASPLLANADSLSFCAKCWYSVSMYYFGIALKNCDHHKK